MELANYKACICEGSAENAIIDILLDYDLMIFKREEMIEEEVLRCREGKKFEQKYLRKGFKDKISVIRILDSRHENFKLSKAYADKVDVINEDLKMAEVKSYDFVKNYFRDPMVLVTAIRKYHEMSRVPRGEYTLLDLLR